MQRICSLVVFIFSTVLFNSASGQVYQLDGMDFENWNQNFYSVIYPSNYYWENEPTNIWASSNAATTIVNDFCCERSADCHGGSYAAHLETKSVFGQPAAGNIFTGYFIADMFNSKAMRGVPFTDKPESMVGYYKYSPATYDNSKGIVPDTCAIYAILSYWDGSQRVEIARAEMYTSNTVSSYTGFDLPFTYYSAFTPDTISVVFASSKYGDLFVGGIGSTLLIDDVHFEYPVGYEEINPLEYVLNENDGWRFSFRTAARRQIIIYDGRGRIVRTGITDENRCTLSSSGLASGLYIYKIVENNKVFGGKLMK